MASNRDPVFTEKPILGEAALATANTAVDGTGTIADVTAAAGADGTRISRLRINATAATTAGRVNFFLHDGTGWHYLDYAAVTAVGTVDDNNAPFRVVWDEINTTDKMPIHLPSGWKLGAAPRKAETFKIIAEGGDYNRADP